MAGRPSARAWSLSAVAATAGSFPAPLCAVVTARMPASASSEKTRYSPATIVISGATDDTAEPASYTWTLATP